MSEAEGWGTDWRGRKIKGAAGVKQNMPPDARQINPALGDVLEGMNG